MTKVGELKPHTMAEAKKARPVKNSTNGYCIEMGALQKRHFPRKTSQETNGMLSQGFIGFPHCVQLDPGLMTDFFSGMR